MSEPAPRGGHPEDVGVAVESATDAVTTTPMLYDMMRESGNRLRAALLADVERSPSPTVRQAAWRRHLQLGDELGSVDPDDRGAVIACRRRWRDEFDALLR